MRLQIAVKALSVLYICSLIQPHSFDIFFPFSSSEAKETSEQIRTFPGIKQNSEHCQTGAATRGRTVILFPLRYSFSNNRDDSGSSRIRCRSVECRSATLVLRGGAEQELSQDYRDEHLDSVLTNPPAPNEEDLLGYGDDAFDLTAQLGRNGTIRISKGAEDIHIGEDGEGSDVEGSDEESGVGGSDAGDRESFRPEPRLGRAPALEGTESGGGARKQSETDRRVQPFPVAVPFGRAVTRSSAAPPRGMRRQGDRAARRTDLRDARRRAGQSAAPRPVRLGKARHKPRVCSSRPPEYPSISLSVSLSLSLEIPTR